MITYYMITRTIQIKTILRTYEFTQMHLAMQAIIMNATLCVDLCTISIREIYMLCQDNSASAASFVLNFRLLSILCCQPTVISITSNTRAIQLDCQVNEIYANHWYGDFVCSGAKHILHVDVDCGKWHHANCA